MVTTAPATLQTVSATSVGIITTVPSTVLTVMSSVARPLMSVPVVSSSVQPLVTGAAMSFDARLIPEFDGSADVVEWFTRAELLCQLRGVAPEAYLPLRLAGDAFVVWQGMEPHHRFSLDAIKQALYAAFALDQFAAYDRFEARRLEVGESADVYLADLRHLAELFGGVSDRSLLCKFVSGLPESVRLSVRASSRADSLELATALSMTRALLSDGRAQVAAAATAAAGADRHRVVRSAPLNPAPEAQSARSVGETSAATASVGTAGVRRRRRCWTCGSVDHLAAACPRRPENVAGEDASQPASSPARH